MLKKSLGDSGKTSLFNGKIIKKNSLIINLLGSIDELSALIQVVLTKSPKKEVASILIRFLSELSKIASAIANEQDFHCQKIIEKMEREIAKIDKKIKPINKFIFFDKSQKASFINLARTVCRRAERNCFKLKNPPKEIGAYLNRLSKLLFFLAILEG